MELLVDVVICRIEVALTLRRVDLIPVFQSSSCTGVSSDSLLADLDELFNSPVIAGLLDVQLFQHIQVHGDAHGIHLARQRIQLATINVRIGHTAGNVFRLGISSQELVQGHNKAACNLGSKVVPVQPHQVGHVIGSSLLSQVFIKCATVGTREGLLNDFDVGVLCTESFQNGLNFSDFCLRICDSDGAFHLVDINFGCISGIVACLRIIFGCFGGSVAVGGIGRRIVAASQNTGDHNQRQDQC